MTYTDHIIYNTAAKNRAKSAEKKQALIEAIYNKIGAKLSKSLTIKELTAVLNQ